MARRVMSASAARFADIVTQVNISSKPVSLIKETGIIPGGFPYIAFNGGAKLRPEGIISAIESTRLVAFNKSSFSPSSYLDADKIYKDYFMFIHAAKMDLDERLYDKTLCKAPLLFDSELEYIGKTSTQLKTTLYLENDSKPLITSRVSTVLVCNKSRVPKPPPDWWIDKYGSAVEKGGQSIGKLEFLGGDGNRSSESCFKVMPLDCDPYRHMNWGNYVKYSHDAVGDFLMEKHGDKGYEEFFSLSLKSLSLLYQKECLTGDLLSVKVTPDNDASSSNEASNSELDKSFFLKVSSDSNVLFESKMEYF